MATFCSLADLVRENVDGIGREWVLESFEVYSIRSVKESLNETYLPFGCSVGF
jgi:hypothetical protein